MDLKDKKILITGASDGIGKQIALQLSKLDTRLILLGRDKERLEDVKEECFKNGSKDVITYSFDLSDGNVITENLERIRKENDDISILINNAGIWQKLGDVDSLNHNAVDQIINTNLTAVIKVTNTLLPILRKQKEAAIINISSKSGVFAQKGQSIYSASKYGVHGFTEVLKADFKDSNIQVAGVYQSGTRTEMFSKAGEEFSNEDFTDPKDLADVIVFMLSRPKGLWLNDVRLNY